MFTKRSCFGLKSAVLGARSWREMQICRDVSLKKELLLVAQSSMKSQRPVDKDNLVWWPKNKNSSWKRSDVSVRNNRFWWRYLPWRVNRSNHIWQASRLCVAPSTIHSTSWWRSWLISICHLRKHWYMYKYDVSLVCRNVYTNMFLWWLSPIGFKISSTWKGVSKCSKSINCI